MDCLIVGGGLIGLLTARELSRAGLEVQLVERGGIGRESSWAGGGILSPLRPWEMPEAVTRLALWSQGAYPGLAGALCDETGIDPEWTRSGLLSLEGGDAARAMQWARAQGVALEVLYDREAIAAIEPHGRPMDRALWLPEVAQVRNPRLVQALARGLELDGVQLRDATGVEALLHRNGRVCGARTVEGTIDAECVVIAGGAWSAGLLEPLGVSIDVRPVKGQMLLYRTEPGLIGRILYDGEHYLVPRRDGHVLIGSTVEDTGFDNSTSPAARAELQVAAAALAPALADCTVVQQWAGLRPAAPDGIPFIGPVPEIAGLYVNAGHYRNGVLLAPASARLLSDMILGRPPLFDPSPYAAKRSDEGSTAMQV